MKNLQFIPETLCFKNPCKQLDTSGYNIFKNSLNISQNVDPKFSKECVHVFEDNDILMQDYNPLESSHSAEIADNYNQQNTSSDAA